MALRGLTLGGDQTLRRDGVRFRNRFQLVPGTMTGANGFNTRLMV